MNIPLPTPAQIEAFILVFLRVSAIIVLMPVFGDQVVPARVKAGLAFILAVLIYPAVSIPQTIGGMDNMALLVVRMGGEIVVGAAIGFAGRIIFAAVQMAGELIGVQMGVSIANVIDPITSTQVSIVAEFLYLIALLVFLTVDAHHIFIAAMSESYKSIPMFGIHLGGGMAREMLLLTQAMFVTAIKISAPVMAVLLFINVGLGIVARTVPQINVFIVGFPLQLAGGLIFIGLSMPFLTTLLSWDFVGIASEVRKILILLGRE
jgi:flagellar biosynthesis protein FliR